MAKEKKQSLIGKVRTRIAPSPTGDPHVGTAFQALLDWVYAKRYQGQFILRIEDTDQKRQVAGIEQNLYEAFSWLGIEPDEGPQKGGSVGPYRQSERLAVYQKYAKQLLDQKDAYYCFCSKERLIKIRDSQREKGLPPKYDRHCLGLSDKEIAEKLESGQKAVIRMRVPDNQKIKVKDELRGEIEFESDTIDDQVLIKSDGFPTYHLAVVVDDHLMGITHVVRGEEWLPSSPKHVLLYKFFNWSVPVLIHTPTLRNTDRSKLSKRKGNTSLWWYRQQGFLPEALLNFLGLMVWKPTETQEIYSLDEMIEKFEWREMTITGPIFDLKKLEWLNGKYLRKLSFEELRTEFDSWLKWVTTRDLSQDTLTKLKLLKQYQQQNKAKFDQVMKLCTDRAKTFLDLPDLIDYYFAESLNYDLQDLLQGKDPQEITKALKLINKRLLDLSDCTQEEWEKIIRKIADELQLEHKDVFMSLRSALTAQKNTPPLYDVMKILGQKEIKSRINNAINYLNDNKN